jgi:hypothetical protein
MRNLNDVVLQVQDDLNDYTPHRRIKYTNLALLAYQELQLKADPKVCVHYFTLNDVLLADLPPDYEFFTKVGVILNRVPYTLTVNNDIQFPRVICGVDTPMNLEAAGTDPNVFGDIGFQWVTHWRAGQYVAENYTLGGGWNSAGYFRVDLKKRQIVMNQVPSAGAQYFMEYVSNGSDGGATMIEQMAFQPIRQYVHWQLKDYQPANIVPMNEKQHREAQWLKAFNDYKDIANAYTIDEFVDKLYGGFTPGIKGISLYGNR